MPTINELLIFSLALFSGLTLLVEFFIAVKYLFLLRVPKEERVRVPYFLRLLTAHIKSATAIIIISGIVAVLNLVSAGIYASQISSIPYFNLLFLIDCLIIEIIIAGWLISWHQKIIIVTVSGLDWNMRFIFFSALFIANLSFLLMFNL